ncbi:hypothetical protein [Chitiniphilus shinanonensis]|uniref:hypothetical protein n=1 Tax=Chitiniphilus shinanonensis TaxID=553088 RepID=UPI00146F387F|nr:hypothetical protein [Chitiniphilus shinanonensis]
MYVFFSFFWGRFLGGKAGVVMLFFSVVGVSGFIFSTLKIQFAWIAFLAFTPMLLAAGVTGVVAGVMFSKGDKVLFKLIVGPLVLAWLALMIAGI